MDENSEEAKLLKEAAESGKMDNPKIDPPDVAEVSNGDTE